jgi:hypothetical protein
VARSGPGKLDKRDSARKKSVAGTSVARKKNGDRGKRV